MSNSIQDANAIFAPDVGTPFQQILDTFREIDVTFSSLQRTTELFLWDGDDVPNDKAAWLAAYFDRLTNSGCEYRSLALQEIRAAGREARASLRVPAFQTIFQRYNSTHDNFYSLAENTESLTILYMRGPQDNERQRAVQQSIDDLRDSVAAIDAKVAPGRDLWNGILPALEILAGSEAALEEAIQDLTNYSSHTGPSATILVVWEEFDKLEEVRTSAYNAARAMLDKAYIIWDLESTTDRDRMNILETMQASHKTLCDQIVPTACLSKRLKDAQMSTISNPDRVVGADGRFWSIGCLRLAMPAYRLIQRSLQLFTEAVEIEMCNLMKIQWRPE